MTAACTWTCPRGPAEPPDSEVRVIVEPLPPGGKRTLLASELLQSGLVGIWAGRKDIGDSHEFARRLRERARRS